MEKGEIDRIPAKDVHRASESLGDEQDRHDGRQWQQDAVIAFAGPRLPQEDKHDRGGQRGRRAVQEIDPGASARRGTEWPAGACLCRRTRRDQPARKREQEQSEEPKKRQAGKTR